LHGLNGEIASFIEPSTEPHGFSGGIQDANLLAIKMADVHAKAI
jgi:hypothetical protein